MDTAAATSLSVSVALKGSTGMEVEARVLPPGEKEAEEAEPEPEEEEDAPPPPPPRPPLLTVYSLGRDQAPWASRLLRSPIKYRAWRGLPDSPTHPVHATCPVDRHTSVRRPLAWPMAQ